MRVLVFGGREYNDRKRVATILFAAKPTEVIHGGCRGTDTIAGEWAKINSIPVREFKADWDRHGRAAGPIRNKQMLDEGRPNLCIGFPGGKGTLNMATQAREAGVEVIMVDEHGR